MKLNEGIHLVKLPNGSVELCAGLETMFCFPQCSEKEFQLLQRLVAPGLVRLCQSLPHSLDQSLGNPASLG